MNAGAPARYRVGLTGGIASGKSTVADMFGELGIDVIDTDVIARDVVMPGSAGLAEVRRAFGDEIVAADGSLDRRRLREIVFGDDEARRTLEGILHPRIRREAERRSREAASPYQIIVVPLLVESPMKDDMDRILVVDCSEETQFERLQQRDSESAEQARRMIAAQASRGERLAIADDVVVNDGARGDTRRQVETLHQKYLSLAGDKLR